MATPTIFATRRPSQLCAPKLVDTRCGVGKDDGTTICCTRRPHSDDVHIDVKHNVRFTVSS